MKNFIRGAALVAAIALTLPVVAADIDRQPAPSIEKIIAADSSWFQQVMAWIGLGQGRLETKADPTVAPPPPPSSSTAGCTNTCGGDGSSVLDPNG